MNSCYESLSDFEINIKVAVTLGYDLHDCYIVRRSKSVRLTGGQEVDYCNNPSDAWPVIECHKFELSYESSYKGKWTVQTYSQDLCSSDKNPLRASMIVFLMMKEKL